MTEPISPDDLKRLHIARNACALALGFLERDHADTAPAIRTALCKGWDAVTELIGDGQFAPGVPNVT